MRNEHLTIIDRNDIQAGVNKNKSLTEIANSIGKPYNTIKKEIIVHRKKIYPTNFNGYNNLCLYYKTKSCNITGLCNVENCTQLCCNCKRHFCHKICTNYTEYLCEKIIKKPFCCNGCEKRKGCRNIKMIYDAKTADIEYHNTLTSSRSGHRLSQEEIDYANTEIKRRIKNGQSLDAIIKTDDNIKGCTSSYYNYTNDGIFEFTNLDLRKKLCYKKQDKNDKNNSKNINENKISKLKENRTYDDFLLFINKYSSFKIVEMDTVIGKITDKKVILTFLFRNSNFMIAFVLNNKQAETINKKITTLKEKIGYDDFYLLFRILLTDNGVEFTLIEEIEKIDSHRNINLFFCDAGKSNQKGKIEKNHVELRKILPKGTSFDNLTQQDLNLAISHINSYPRRKFNYKSSCQILKEEIGEDIFNNLLNILGYKMIDAQDVILSPKLIKTNNKNI